MKGSASKVSSTRTTSKDVTVGILDDIDMKGTNTIRLTVY